MSSPSQQDAQQAVSAFLQASEAMRAEPKAEKVPNQTRDIKLRAKQVIIAYMVANGFDSIPCANGKYIVLEMPTKDAKIDLGVIAKNFMVYMREPQVQAMGLEQQCRGLCEQIASSVRNAEEGKVSIRVQNKPPASAQLEMVLSGLGTDAL